MRLESIFEVDMPGKGQTEEERDLENRLAAREAAIDRREQEQKESYECMRNNHMRSRKFSVWVVNFVSWGTSVLAATSPDNKWIERSFALESFITGYVNAVGWISARGDMTTACVNFVGVTGIHWAMKNLVKMSGTAYAKEVECLCSALVISTSLFCMMRSIDSYEDPFPLF